MPPANKEELLQFQQAIETIVEKRSTSYMDAILIFCEENDYEPERIPRYLSSALKAKLADEAASLKLIKRDKTDRALPV